MAAPRHLVSGIESPMKDRELLAQRRRELVRAATEVFLERGFARTSVNEIAERCGWSIGSLYKYVGSKDDILILVCADILGHLRAEDLLPDPQGSPVDRFREAYSRYCDVFSEKRQEVLLFYREFPNMSRTRQRHFVADEAKVVDFFRGLVEEGVAAGNFVCDDPHLFAVDCIARAHGLALKGWAIGDRDPVSVRDHLVGWALTALHCDGVSARARAVRRGGRGR